MRSRISVVERQRHPVYLPFYAALADNVFADFGLEVNLLPGTGGPGGQMRQNVDLHLGGPMRALSMLDRGENAPVSIATVARRAPWVIGMCREAVSLEELCDVEVINYAEAPTPLLLMRGLLVQEGLALAKILTPEDLPEAVAMFSRSSNRALLIDSWRLAQVPGGPHVVFDLAGATGDIPFSTFAAHPDVLERDADKVNRFVEAYQFAQQAFLQRIDACDTEYLEEVADAAFGRLRGFLVSEECGRLRALNVWPETVSPTDDEFDRFAGLLHLAGWIASPDVPPGCFRSI